MKYILFAFFLIITALVVNVAYAAVTCKQIYGGGTTSACISPTVATKHMQPSQQTKQIAKQPQGFAPQTNQNTGNIVYPSQTTQTTPATGPETISLLALATSGLLGVIVRRKTANA